MKHNSNIQLFKIALLIGVLGLIILLGIIILGAADPGTSILHWYSNRVVTLLLWGRYPNNHCLYL